MSDENNSNKTDSSIVAATNDFNQAAVDSSSKSPDIEKAIGSIGDKISKTDGDKISKTDGDKPDAKKLYVLTEEHRAQLEPWREKWIKNALRTGLMDDAELKTVTCAIKGLYAAAGLETPRVVFAPSPFAAAFAAGLAGGIWHQRREGKATPLKVKLDDFKGMGGVYEATARCAIHALGDQMEVDYEPVKMLGLTPPDKSNKSSWESLEPSRWYHLGGSLPTDIKRLAGMFGDTDFMTGCISNAYRLKNGGNHWSGYAAFISFFRHVVKLPIDFSKWEHYEAASIAGPRYMHKDFCIVSQRPIRLAIDDQNRPHTDDGPFCKWIDGSMIYSHHGVRCPGRIIEYPDCISLEMIDKEQNAEIRRVMIDKYGPGKYLQDSGATLVDIDTLTHVGSAVRGLFEDKHKQRWLVGSDGSTKRVYHMPAPANATTCRSAHEALAGFDESRLIAEA